MSLPENHQRSSGGVELALGAPCVVFGDIGTSPLYALRDTFARHHPLPLDGMHVLSTALAPSHGQRHRRRHVTPLLSP